MAIYARPTELVISPPFFLRVQVVLPLGYLVLTEFANTWISHQGEPNTYDELYSSRIPDAPVAIITIKPFHWSFVNVEKVKYNHK